VLLRPIVGLLAIVSLTVAVLSAQAPHREFVWDPDTCCCHHAGPCPCPGHQLPAHEKTPALHKCGSGGHEVVTPSVLSLVMPAPYATDAVVAIASPALPLLAPHGPPILEPPSAPS
jgi:hypothetical protein